MATIIIVFDIPEDDEGSIDAAFRRMRIAAEEIDGAYICSFSMPRTEEDSDGTKG